MLLINAVIVLLMFLLSRWSIGSGFLDYVNKSEQQRMTTLVDNLSDYYQQHGSFSALAEDGAWPRYVHRPRFIELEPPTPVIASKREPTHHRRERGAKYHLLDRDKRQIAGPSYKNIKSLLLIPIEVDEQTVGYLAFKQHKQIASRLDRLFIERQTANLVLIGGFLLLSAALLALLIAAQLVRPLKRMAVATQAMAAGDYQVRIAADSSEEIAALAMDINNLATSLEQNREARQHWIADIAHELRTPLAVVTGEIEAMIDGVRPSSRQGLESLKQEVWQLTRLVNDLRELANSDRGALEYHKLPMTVAEVVQQVCDSARGELEERAINLRLELSSSQQIWADEARMRQLFSNLMQNTLRYTDAPGKLWIKLYQQDDRLVIEWQDSSPGVSDEELPRLTERLYRVEQSRSRVEGGSGLGLSIVANICAAHEGRLSVQHSPLGGIAWRFSFKLIDEQ
ncbi:ATP-binding protein [Sinobacterium caligoides]|nr:ATP-binding protein [Sinobacterium caligoides]